MTDILRLLVGYEISVTRLDGSVLDGVLVEVSNSFDITLAMSQVRDDSGATATIPTRNTNPFQKKTVVKRTEFEKLTVLRVVNASITPSVGMVPSTSPVPGDFRTDTQISGRMDGENSLVGRELQKWTGNVDPSVAKSLDELRIGSWDQFNAPVNKKQQKMSGASGFSEERYTTPLDPALYRKYEKDAGRIAKEIESSHGIGGRDADGAVVLNRRGSLLDNEEDLFSTVQKASPELPKKRFYNSALGQTSQSLTPSESPINSSLKPAIVDSSQNASVAVSNPAIGKKVAQSTNVQQTLVKIVPISGSTPTTALPAYQAPKISEKQAEIPATSPASKTTTASVPASNTKSKFKLSVSAKSFTPTFTTALEPVPVVYASPQVNAPLGYGYPPNQFFPPYEDYYNPAMISLPVPVDQFGYPVMMPYNQPVMVPVANAPIVSPLPRADPSQRFPNPPIQSVLSGPTIALVPPEVTKRYSNPSLPVVIPSISPSAKIYASAVANPPAKPHPQPYRQ